MINVIVSTWYKIKHRLYHERIILCIANRSKMRVLQHSIIGKIEPLNRLMTRYANLVIKIIKLCMNCGIIAILMGKILSMTGNILSTAQKHNIAKILSIISWGLIQSIL